MSLEDGRPKDALAYAERAKARVLLEALRDGRVVISKVMTADEKSRERTWPGVPPTRQSQISTSPALSEQCGSRPRAERTLYCVIRLQGTA